MNFGNPRQFDPATFTELAPRFLTISCAEALAAAKQELLATLLKEHAASVSPELLIGAVNDAEALATLTLLPVLFLSALAEEKVQAARTWAERQRRMLGGVEISLAA